MSKNFFRIITLGVCSLALGVCSLALEATQQACYGGYVGNCNNAQKNCIKSQNCYDLPTDVPDWSAADQCLNYVKWHSNDPKKYENACRLGCNALETAGVCSKLPAQRCF